MTNQRYACRIYITAIHRVIQHRACLQHHGLQSLRSILPTALSATDIIETQNQITVFSQLTGSLYKQTVHTDPTTHETVADDCQRYALLTLLLLDIFHNRIVNRGC
ncbi:hypothetical protein D3C74_373650 [compost metagenome]